LVVRASSGEDEWHTTGSKYLQKRVARGVFDDDDWLTGMEFGTVVGWLPVEVADFVSEHTNKVMFFARVLCTLSKLVQ
jgi:hypothetical protein